MDDFFAINNAKTEFREAYNSGNPESLIAVLDAEAVYFADAQRMAIGAGCADVVRAHFGELFGRFEVHVDPIIIEIRIQGDVACEYGWHEWTLRPKDGGETFRRKDRYVDVWRRNAAGEWKLWTYMDNVDVPMTMPATAE